MTLAAGGWPVSMDTYYPYGVEPTPPPSPDHYKFAGMERDQESGLDHTQFRQYAAIMGRFMTPDPYNGSYDVSNPQSMNRYTYAMNNPLSNVDPTGLDPDCGLIQYTESGMTMCGGGDGGSGDGGNGNDGYLTDYGPGGGSGGTGGYGGGGGGSAGNPSTLGSPQAANNGLPTPTLRKLTIPGTNYCGPGGSGTPTGQVDARCAAHDRCYQNAGATFKNNIPLWPASAQQRGAMHACDANLCSTVSNIYYPTQSEAGQTTLVETYFGRVPRSSQPGRAFRRIERAA